MWLFTQYGFYSVEQNNEDPDAFSVCACLKNDLENLLRLTQIETSISETSRAEYAYRVLLSRAEWERISRILACAVDYPSFMDRVYDLPDQCTKTVAYMNIWTTMKNIAEPSTAQIESGANTLRKETAEPLGNAEESLVLSLFHQAEDWMKNGEIDKALERCDLLIQHAPNFPNTYIVKGFALSKCGRHEESVDALQTGLRLMPDNTGAWRLLALKLIQLERIEEAVGVLGEICHHEPDALDAKQLHGYAYALANGFRIPMPLYEWLDTHPLNQIDLQDGATLYLIGLHFLCMGLKDKANDFVATVQEIDEAWANELQRVINRKALHKAEDTPQWEKENVPLQKAIARFGTNPQGEGLEIVISALNAGWAALLSDQTDGGAFSLMLEPLPQLNGTVGLAAFTSRESSRLFAGDKTANRIVQGGDSLIDFAVKTYAVTGEPIAIVLDAAGPQFCVLPIAALLQFQQKTVVATPLFLQGSEDKEPEKKSPRTLALLESRGLLSQGDELELIKLPKKNLVLPDAAQRAIYSGKGKAQWQFDGNEYSLSTLCGEIVRRFGNIETPGSFRGPDFWAKNGSQLSLTQLAST